LGRLTLIASQKCLPEQESGKKNGFRKKMRQFYEQWSMLRRLICVFLMMIFKENIRFNKVELLVAAYVASLAIICE
jgi:hypothetical protein